MKLLTSVAFGAAALVMASFGASTPAKADSFGVYLGGPGYHHSYDRYHRCDSWRYRRRHPYRCRYYDDDFYGDDYYYNDYYRPGFGIFFGSDRHRHWRHGHHKWRHGHRRHRHGHHRRHRH